MTYDEWAPMAAQLSQASLATFTAVVDSMTRQTKAQAWALALADLPAAEVAEAVDWLVSHATEPVSRPGLVRARVETRRREIQPTPGGSTPRYAGGERTYRCLWCNDTGTVDAVFERWGMRQVGYVPCLRCPEGARMATHARSLPEDVAVVRKFDRLCGSFDDPDDLMGYRKLPDHSAPEPAQNAPGRPRTNDRPPVGGAGQGKVE